MADCLKVLEETIAWVKFGKKVSNKLSNVRFIHESDMDTLKRIVEQAQKTICQRCRGSGHNIIGGECRECHGTGEKPYDPYIKDVENIMQT